MTKNHKIIVSLFLIGFLGGCGVANRLPQRPPPVQAEPKETEKPSLPSAIHVSTYNEIALSLQQAYRDWRGTPYEWGGKSSAGVDCSAFMQLIFSQYFGVDLPRSTRRQLYVGTEVSPKKLKTGDLIFFKTGRKTLHVGVIIEDLRFLHASTSQGVTVSSLDDYYWRSRFISAKRVL